MQCITKEIQTSWWPNQCINGMSGLRTETVILHKLEFVGFLCKQYGKSVVACLAAYHHQPMLWQIAKVEYLRWGIRRRVYLSKAPIVHLHLPSYTGWPKLSTCMNWSSKMCIRLKVLGLCLVTWSELPVSVSTRLTWSNMARETWLDISACWTFEI